ncbi:polyprenyl synthetase family protein [Conexivisphaera calida]|uniref:Octaprenyl diphosphate synthase n=1 Tax=Conexivisphaera calida TaxID=1874277 RepID=A0A4P2VGK6_9ARCH|nr:polyprenyl synthetase family protein [Conexivisphaera calida]BBE43007.1 Octaprenyl diphosphate synthase [Conexivisphaera calida]
MASEWTGVDRRAKDYAQIFGGLLARLDSEVSTIIDRYSGNPLVPMLEYAMGGGKRLRPLVAVLVNESIGPRNASPYPASMIPELLHTISVVHDDIIDEEVARRGRMPFHKVYGVGRSLVLADFAFSIILDITSSYGRDGAGLLGPVSRAAMMMAEGEERELELVTNGRATRDEYFEVIGLKTASLFEVAAELGALLSVNPELATIASSFGWHLGMGYQMADDLEDMRGGSKKELVNLVSPRLTKEELLDRMRLECAKAAEALDGLPPGHARDGLAALIGFILGSEEEGAPGNGPSAPRASSGDVTGSAE